MQSSEKSIDRTGHAMHVLQNFDKISKVKPPSGKHPEPKQLDIIVKELKKQKVFDFKPGRKHGSFPDFPADPLCKLKGDKFKLRKWLQDQRRQAATDQAIQTMKF